MSARGKRDIAALQASSLRVVDYFRTEFDELEPVIGTGRRDWSLVGKIVRSRGLVDAYGKVASRAALARAWKKVGAERRQASAWETKVHFVAPARSRDPPRDLEKSESRAIATPTKAQSICETPANSLMAVEQRRRARDFYA